MNDLDKVPFELLVELYMDYKASNIWKPPSPFLSTIEYVKYGVRLKREVEKRDRKRGSVIL